jgi:outer membrane protein assembly factor BamB
MKKATLLLLPLCLALLAADWPQWRGPGRDGISPEKGLLKAWPKAGPKLLWTFDKAGNGYGSFAVVGGTLYTMGARGDDEYVLAVDDKGKEKWATKIGPVFDFKGNDWSRGPNAAPSVDGDLVFGLGSQGVLLCVNKNGGAEVWRKDLPKELAAEVNPVGGGPEKMGWGYSWSPLVDGDKLIIVPGGPKGLFAALDKKTGKVLWRSKDVTEQATYSSPVVAEVGGVRQYVTVVQDGVVGVSAKDGARLWKYKPEEAYADVVCATPVVRGELVYVTVGYGGGSVLLKLTAAGGKVTADKVYAEEKIGNRQGGVVLLGKNVYGYHDDREWVCQDFAKGGVVWANRARTALKASAVIAAEDRLYALDEKGTVGLLEASPPGYKELGRFKLPQEPKKRKPRGGIWTHPALSDGKLYLRDQELIFCYLVK